MEIPEKTVFEEGEVLFFNKPLYWTSFDLVNKIRIMIRSRFGIRKIKVGHAGTLDPLATGLMIICTGKATKRINSFMGLDKEYIATIQLGATTPSYDLETEINARFETEHITEKMVLSTLKNFIGKQPQTPPLHSAKFIDGKRAYVYARKGIEKELKPSEIEIIELELLHFAENSIKLKVRCSKGTYIRSLARDLGEALNSGAYLSSLERTAIGTYSLSGAYSLEKFGILLEEMKSKNDSLKNRF